MVGGGVSVADPGDLRREDLDVKSGRFALACFLWLGPSACFLHHCLVGDI